MEFRDPVHGTILIHPEEEKIISHPFFQRLRNIKQLGLSDFSFPAATHTRFLHSLGCMHIATKAIDKIFSPYFPQYKQNSDFRRLEKTLRLAALVHDIGHAPLSHSTEIRMPMVSTLKLINAPKIDRQASHEDYTIKSVTDSFFTDSFTEVILQFGVDPKGIAALISGTSAGVEDYFVINGINFFPLLTQLISSEMDCDRMDYLLRDSYFCGVSYGQFDLNWLLENITYTIQNNMALLTLQERALSAFDNFLLGRYHMFLMVYFHYRSSCLEHLLHAYFNNAPQEYNIPSRMEDYLHHDDHYLWQIIKNSKNPYAQQIATNDIPMKFFESYSDLDHIKTHTIHEMLDGWKIEHVYTTSQGRLSKYRQNAESSTLTSMGYPICVQTNYPNKVKKIIEIGKATRLFEQFQKGHSIKRIHFNPKQLSPAQLNLVQQIFKED